MENKENSKEFTLDGKTYDPEQIAKDKMTKPSPYYEIKVTNFLQDRSEEPVSMGRIEVEKGKMFRWFRFPKGSFNSWEFNIVGKHLNIRIARHQFAIWWNYNPIVNILLPYRGQDNPYDFRSTY